MAVDVQFANTDYSSFLVGDYFFDDDNNNCSSYLVEDDPLDQYYLHFDEQQQLLFKEEAIAESSYDLQLQTELESLIYLDPPANLDNAMTTSAAAYSIDHNYPNFPLVHEIVPSNDQLLLANSHVDSTVLSQLLAIESLQQPPVIAPSFERCDLGTTPPIWYDSIPSRVNFAPANKRKRFSTLEPCTNYTFIDPNIYRYNNHHVHQFLQDDYADHHLNFHRGLPVSNFISGGGGGVDYPTSGYFSNNNYMNSAILSTSLMNSELNGLQFAHGVTTTTTTASTVNAKKEELLNITGGGACAEHDEQVKSSTTAQSRAARERRRKIAHKMQELGKLLPDGGKGVGGGGVGKMNTAEMLQAAFKYVKFLQAQVSVLEAVNSSPPSSFQKSGDARDNNLWILWSDAVQEKLYRSEKCLIPTELVNQLASDENLSEKDPVTASNLKQLLMTTK